LPQPTTDPFSHELAVPTLSAWLAIITLSGAVPHYSCTQLASIQSLRLPSENKPAYVSHGKGRSAGADLTRRLLAQSGPNRGDAFCVGLDECEHKQPALKLKCHLVGYRERQHVAVSHLAAGIHDRAAADRRCQPCTREGPRSQSVRNLDKTIGSAEDC
jgi:hypothetical protein